MEAKLVVVGGKANKGSVSLTLPAVIGRSQDAGVTIGHRTVSRRHAEIFEKSGLLMIRDLGSLNGTIIDGKPIKEAAPLPPDAEFTIGPLTFRIQYQYNGDTSKLPVHAPDRPASGEKAAKPTTEPSTDLPDFEPVEQTPPTNAVPAKGAPAKRASAEVVPAEGKDATPAQSSGDPFEDLLNELY
jgi:predicted component of type VI protein secretion system